MELVSSSDLLHVSDWSHDGKRILYGVITAEGGSDVWYLERDDDGGSWEPHLFLSTPFLEGTSKFSPDGRYVAYFSNESGRNEIYVRSFPDGGGKTVISRNGGKQVRWSADGREIFYVEGLTLMAASVSTSPSFSVVSVGPLFTHPSLGSGFVPPQYDVSSDGQRFLLLEPIETVDAAPSIRVVENWYEEFRGRN